MIHYVSLKHNVLKQQTQRTERILKVVREKKQITYESKPIKITADFSTDLNSKKDKEYSRH
jgi:hypothetical protein